MLLAKTLTSSTFKLALIAIGTFGVIVSVIFGYVYLSTSSYVRSRSDHAIMTEYSSLLAAYERNRRDGLIALIQQRIADKSFADNVYLLVEPSLAVLGGNLGAWPSTVTVARGWTEFRAPESSDAPRRPLLRAMIETFPSGDRLLVGKDISDLDSFTDQIKTAVVSAVALIFVLAGVASILVTRRTVGRIESINATSQAIMLSGLDKRIPLRGTNDEWDRVAENLNLMLDRIETLMGEVKQVSDSVAHDLRTPLTRMRGRLEKAFHGPRIGENDQLLIGDTIADLDAVLRILLSIMRIAQIETQARKEAFRSVNLAEIAGEVVELYDAAAEQDGTRLTVVGDREVLVTGDRDLIFDAIANLVDNAIKHGRAGGQVVVANENIDGQPMISIADDGRGIPPDQYEHVFKRFYRLEHSRYTPGNGLGLSLVAAVARLHGARIEMLDNSPGLTFRLWFSAPTG
ncbi:Signal transduction histidine kinase [Bradyrhizobium erythrophlei]|uniref:histidine kinase n=1 Tax=Bradyrhizobium erythrophlei TaxID=1437360 RepID=A0A1M5GYN9_9BRAD|nr:ATP-binding protein [Bradyrhizobium erythrophlei]SHG08622.1 Signal transduction histidine kinase [Bradyrhizobium erythrophlei]